ncbi:unnamed protein product, partial [Iphiclides podalirius]
MAFRARKQVANVVRRVRADTGSGVVARSLVGGGRPASAPGLTPTVVRRRGRQSVGQGGQGRAREPRRGAPRVRGVGACARTDRYAAPRPVAGQPRARTHVPRPHAIAPQMTEPARARPRRNDPAPSTRRVLTPSRATRLYNQRTQFRGH